MREIPLTKGYVALVDDADYEWLSQWKWCYGAGGYAIRGRRLNGKQYQVRMHRVILGLPDRQEDGREGDHKNGDRLDNRRANLRILTLEHNRQNRSTARSNTGVRNVSRQPQGYVARLYTGGRDHYLGTFKTLDDAAAAAAAGRLRLMPGALG